jgi:hypothetical protein
MRHTFTEALGKHNFTEKKRKEKVGRSLKATDPPMAKMFRPLGREAAERALGGITPFRRRHEEGGREAAERAGKFTRSAGVKEGAGQYH